MSDFRKLILRSTVLAVPAALTAACSDHNPAGMLDGSRRGPIVLLTAADSTRFLASRSATLIAASPPQGSVDRSYIYTGETITVTITSAECSGVGDVMEVRGPVSGTVSTDACNGVGSSITLGPSPSDGPLQFVLTDQRYGSGPFAVTGTYPDFTVYVEDGFGDLDYNDNILSLHFTPPTCPPSGDPVVDAAAVRHGLRDELAASNPNATPGSGSKLEHGGVIWQRPDGSLFTQDITDPGATECQWQSPGAFNPPEPGAVGIAKFHTHPQSYQEPTYGCPGNYAKVVGDHLPVAHGAPDQNGGGSDADWDSGTGDGFPMYVINKDGRVYRLDPNTPKNQRPNNSHRWEWKNPSSPGCITP